MFLQSVARRVSRAWYRTPPAQLVPFTLVRRVSTFLPPPAPRSDVLGLYRKFFRAAQAHSDPVVQDYVRDRVRTRFRKNALVLSEKKKRMLMREARKLLRRIRRAVQGERSAAQYLLELAYGRRGALKHTLFRIADAQAKFSRREVSQTIRQLQRSDLRHVILSRIHFRETHRKEVESALLESADITKKTHRPREVDEAKRELRRTPLRWLAMLPPALRAIVEDRIKHGNRTERRLYERAFFSFTCRLILREIPEM